MEMDMESHNSNTYGFEVRAPGRSYSITSNTTDYKHLGSDDTGSKTQSQSTAVKKETHFTRKLPILADVIILITQLLLTGCFVYFAYFYKPIDTLSCEAAYGDNQPVTT